jgi:hypothetical protein
LSIARLSPGGRVVLTDLVAEMLDIAARRARAQGVANIGTTVCSAAGNGPHVRQLELGLYLIDGPPGTAGPATERSS